jgi:hypothetical protein
MKTERFQGVPSRFALADCMDIVRVACATAESILAVIVNPDHDVRMAEGLARWNGQNRTWIEKRNGWTLGFESYEDQWLAVDFSGLLRLYDAAGLISTASCPRGLNDLYVRGPEILAVGVDGGFFRYVSGSWERIQHPFQSHLYSISATDEAVYACGAAGVILRYTDSRCEQVKVDGNYDFTSISCTKDGAIFAAGGQGESGVLVEVDKNRIHDLSSRQQVIRALARNKVYGIDWDGVIWVWEGRQSSPISIDSGFHALCLSRSGPFAIGGRDQIAIEHQDALRTVPLTLDASFLLE